MGVLAGSYGSSSPGSKRQSLMAHQRERPGLAVELVGAVRQQHRVAPLSTASSVARRAPVAGSRSRAVPSSEAVPHGLPATTDPLYEITDPYQAFWFAMRREDADLVHLGGWRMYHGVARHLLRKQWWCATR